MLPKDIKYIPENSTFATLKNKFHGIYKTKKSIQINTKRAG